MNRSRGTLRMASSSSGSCTPRAAICRRTIVSRSLRKSCIHGLLGRTLALAGSLGRDPLPARSGAVILRRMTHATDRSALPPPPADLAPQPLDRATALPARFYADPAYAAVDRALVFDRGWQLVAHVCQLRNAGDHAVADFAGLPVLAVRGADDVIRVFPHVCRTRAGPFAQCTCIAEPSMTLR